MIETIIVWTIIAVSAFFIGRKFWYQWKAAISKNGEISCGGCCSCDSGAFCPTKPDDRKQ